MIDVRDLIKTFGTLRAVDGVTFSVPRGQILGFLGPNGAGKSTTMKMLTCFLEPTSGTARVGGKDVVADSIEVRRQIGYLPESAPSYGEMTVEEFLRFVGEVRGLRGSALRSALGRMSEVCALTSVWHQPIETLSKGYRQRVGFAQALVHDPPVLVLDEPTDGLDPNQKHEVRSLIRRMGNDKTIILSTHILEEVEAVCSRVVIIAQGKIVADATPTALVEQSSSHNAVVLTLSPDDLGRAEHFIAGLDHVARVEPVSDRPATLRVYPRGGRPIVGPISQAVRDQKWSVAGIHVEHGRLDEVFRRVTLGGQGGATPSSPAMH